MLTPVDPDTLRTRWDTRYEIKVIGILTLAFGLVGLDRFIINPLSPVIMRELHIGGAGAVREPLASRTRRGTAEANA